MTRGRFTHRCLRWLLVGVLANTPNLHHVDNLEFVLAGRACLLLWHKFVIVTFRMPYWLKQWPGACHCLELIGILRFCSPPSRPSLGLGIERAVVVFVASGDPPTYPNLPPAAVRESHSDGSSIPV